MVNYSKIAGMAQKKPKPKKVSSGRNVSKSKQQMGMGKGKRGLGMVNVMTGQQANQPPKKKVKRVIDTQKKSKSPVAAKPKPKLQRPSRNITGDRAIQRKRKNLAGGGKTSKYRMAGGGKTSKYRMAGGGKMPMVMKDGKKIPAFAADGKGKMKKGGKAKLMGGGKTSKYRMKGGGKTSKYMAKGGKTSKYMRRGGKVK